MAEGVLIDNLMSIFVIGGLGILVYCKFMDKTLLDVFTEIREMFSTQTEEVDMHWT